MSLLPCRFLSENHHINQHSKIICPPDDDIGGVSVRAVSLYILGLEGLAEDGKLQMMLQGGCDGHFVSGSNYMGFRARLQEGGRLPWRP